MKDASFDVISFAIFPVQSIVMHHHYICLLLLSCFFTSSISAQNPMADIEGDLKIRGDLDLHHQYDSSSVVIGHKAGSLLSPGNPLANTFVGSRSGLSTTTGQFNCFFGYQSGENDSTGSRNSFFGYESGADNILGNDNSFFGYRAGGQNINGREHTFLGYLAGINNYKGSRSVALGSFAGGLDTSIERSVYLGSLAGYAGSLCSREGNVFIGYAAGFNEQGSDRLYIDNAGQDSASALIYGDFDNHLLRVNGALYLGGNASKMVLGNGGDIFFKTTNGVEKPILSLHSDDHTYLDAEKDLVFRTNGLDQQMRVGASGEVTLTDLVGTGTADVQVDANGKLMRAASDRRLKKNIKPIKEALLKVLQLQGVSYQWKDKPTSDLTLGLLAQEVMQVLPEIVHSDGEYYGINYSELPALLVEAIKEQQRQIEDLRRVNALLAERLDRLDDRE